MNPYLQAVILGIVEGLTEFLPVSSTAHIRIAQALMHIDVTSEYWKMFAVVIQLGAILAVVLFFGIDCGSSCVAFREVRMAIDRGSRILFRWSC